MADIKILEGTQNPPTAKTFQQQQQEQLTQQPIQTANSLSQFYKTIPKELVRIPSNGYVYGKETGLMNSPNIEVRYLTTADEDDLTSPSLIRTGTWLTKVLKNCIVNTTIDVNNLLVGDRNAVLFWLRQSAYGTNYEVQMICRETNCGKSFPHSFQLNQLALKTLDIKPVSPGVNEFDFQLPYRKLNVIFALITGKMAEEIEKETEALSKAGKDAFITSRLKKQLVEVAGVRDRNEINRFVAEGGMVASDAWALREYIDKITPDIQITQTVTCPNCGATNEFDMPLNEQFFWPSSRRRASL